jgi:hypothetical protein
MKRPSLRPAVLGWPVGSLLLLSVLAGPCLAAGSISGKLTGPATRPIAGARINATDSQFRNFRAVAEADGTYSIADLEPGTYTVVIVGAGMEPVVKPDVAVKDGQDLKLDVTLEEAKVFPIAKAAKPIPLTDDYYSASFADAPEIMVNQSWQNTPDLDPSVGTLTNWKPEEVSGKFRLKYSDLGIHLAADLNFKTPGVNRWPDMGGREIWDGNHIDFFFQNDPYDPTREEYTLDHNWQLATRLTDVPAFKLFQRGMPPENQDPPKEDPKAFVLRKVKPNKDGELVRIDYPWTIFLQNGSSKQPIPVPAANSMAALDLAVGAADPDQPAEEAGIKTRLSWSGFFEGWKDPRLLRPVIFGP